MPALPAQPVMLRMTRRRTALATALYVRALLREFRTTLSCLGLLIILAAFLHFVAPANQLDPPQRIGVGDSIYAGWMALLAQPRFATCPWYLKAVYGIYPVFGLTLIGEGVVRLALLIISKRQGEKEWMQVVASTYRDHVILCGLGHLGIRVLEQLVASNAATVVLERSAANPFLTAAKTMRVPVLIRDMKEDEALIDAGIEHAAAIVICTNHEMTNLEVAIDARRMNPDIRVVMRLFEQQLASKIAGPLSIDAPFSSSSLAAPIIAAMAFKARVLSTISIGGVPHVTAEVTVDRGCALEGRKITDVESIYFSRVLARTPMDGTLQSPPVMGHALMAGDGLVVHTSAEQLPTIAGAAHCGIKTR